MRLLICGDRYWRNYHIIHKVVTELQETNTIECIIEGEAQGADTIGRQVAEDLGIPVVPFPADWKKYSRAAGSIRNMEMLMKGRPDFILAFHDDIGNSKGTKHMIKIAGAAGINFKVYRDH